MEAAVKKMGEELRLWGLKIGHLAARAERAGIGPGYEAVMYIDELKALHAIAQSRLEAYQAAGEREGEQERERLRAELKSACDELGAALDGSP